MLITKDLEYPILYEPALANGMKCNNLRIITGCVGVFQKAHSDKNIQAEACRYIIA